MTSESTPFEIFISYSRRDNDVPPDAPPGAKGWVIALRDQILADHRDFSTEPLNIFLDTEEILDMDDWRFRILGALRHSKILLVCLSPNYFGSDYCLWEWEEYLRRQVHQLMGSDSIATIYFTEVPGSNEYANATWLNSLLRSNYTNLIKWFPLGAEALQRDEVRTPMAKLGESLWERVQRARRASGVPGNLRQQSPHFVGRKDELDGLHKHLATGAIGVVTVIHGVGGQGKTELAVAYAHRNADLFPVGLWVLGAEGKKELLPLIAELADAPEFGYRPTDAERKEPVLLGRAVLEELRRRASAARERDPDRGAAVLLLLDNVSEPVLLALTQLTTFPRANWLRIVATTRLGPDQLRVSDKSLAFVAVDSLPEDDSLALMREHQSGQLFRPDAEEAAAREIVRELGGFTLAVEQVAVHLGLHPEISPSAFLSGLLRKGLSSVDHLGKRDDVQARILHQEKQLNVILQDTLSLLDAPAKTALEFAALLPPDNVPWPWLKGLVTEIHPELAKFDSDEPDPWMNTRRRLEGQRLLTPGDHPEVARLHRMVGAYLDAQLKTEGRHAQLLQRLKAVLSDRAKVLGKMGCRDGRRSWELNPLTEAALLLSNQAPELDEDLASVASLAGGIEFLVGRLGRAKELLFIALKQREAIFETNRDSVAAARKLLLSLRGMVEFHVAIGDHKQAASFLQSAAGCVTVLCQLSPNSVETLEDECTFQRQLAENYFQRQQGGDLERAIECWEKAAKIVDDLIHKRLDSVEAQIFIFWAAYDIAESRSRVYPVLLERGDSNLAARYIKRALSQANGLDELAKALNELVPENAVMAWTRTAAVKELLGRCYYLSGDAGRAIEVLRQAKDIGERFRENNPDSTMAAHCLGQSLRGLELSYSMRAESGDSEKSKKYAGMAEEIEKELREKDPDAHPQ